MAKDLPSFIAQEGATREGSIIRERNFIDANHYETVAYLKHLDVRNEPKMVLFENVPALNGQKSAFPMFYNPWVTRQYVTTLDREFNQLTPENEMKWETTEPSRDSFNFSAADQLVSHAQAQGMAIRGHTLVWHSQLPGWVSGISSRDELLSVMRNHIVSVFAAPANSFRGKFTS